MISRHAWSGLRDDRGAVAPITAILLVSLFGFGALVTDIGLAQLTRRQLQAATDAAALAATYTVAGTEETNTSTSGWVSDYLTRNGFSGATVTTLQTGTYCPESGVLPANRFTSGTTSCAGFADLGIGPNAVRVTTTESVPLFLGRVLLPGKTNLTVGATATAAQIPQAGFFAGTGLLSVNTSQSPILNAVLGGMLGTSVNLTAVQYQGLLNTNISAFSFFGALATNIGVSAGTYSSLLNSNVTVQQVLQAEASALNSPGSVAAVALNELAADVTGSPTVALGSLFDLGVWQSQGIGSSNPPPALTATLNAYQLAALTVQVANGQHAVTIPPSSLGIPGVATVSLAATVIEPPVSAPFVFGPIGMSVHTAQVRLQLTLTLLGALTGLPDLLQAGTVTIPIYVEVANGEATLSKITCGFNPATDAQVTIEGQSAAAQAWVGTVSSGAMSNFTSEPTVSPAALVNLSLSILGVNVPVATINGSAEVTVGSPAPTPLVFTQTDIADGTIQTVTSTGMLSTLLGSLSNHLTLSVTLLGGSLSAGTILSAVTTPLTTLLAPLFAGLDSLVDTMLTALGIKIGYMDVTVTGVRCGSPVLVD